MIYRERLSSTFKTNALYWPKREVYRNILYTDLGVSLGKPYFSFIFCFCMSCRCSVRKFLEAYAARANRAKILQKLSLHEATNQTGSSIKVFFALANREYLFVTLFSFK